MIGAFKANIALYGGSEDDKKSIQRILDGYKNIELDHQQKGRIRVVDSLDEMQDEVIGINLNVPGEASIRVEGSDVVIRYSQEDRQCFLEQLVLLFTGNKVLDADLADMMPILKKGCSFHCRRVTEDSFCQLGEELISEVLDTSGTGVSVVAQVCGNMTPLLAFQLFEKMGDSDKVETVVCQIVQGDYDGECIISLFNN